MRALILRTEQFRYETYLKYDNAKDNRNKYLFGLCGWLLKRRRTKRFKLTSGVVGHTHEDIDALFRFLGDELMRRGFVATIDEYLDAIANAFSDPENVHVELVHCVLDVAGWLKPYLWGDSFKEGEHSVKYYAEAHAARYFILELWHPAQTAG